MNKENLFREIFSLYSLINKQIDEYTSVNKNNINEIKEAQKTLRGLYNQYDCVKTNIYPIIVTGLKNNIPKYSQMLEKENITLREVFNILSDNLKNNKDATNHIKKLEILSIIPINNIFINKVKKIIKNIKITFLLFEFSMSIIFFIKNTK